MLKSQHQSIIRSVAVWNRDVDRDTFSLSDSIDAEATPDVEDLVTCIQSEKSCGILHQDYAPIDNQPDEEVRAAIGIPVIKSGNVESVLVLTVECSPSIAGAIEVWERDSGRDELGLRGAVFSNLRRFAGISQFVKFPRGSGLPGRCWEDREVKLVDRLGSSLDFMRAAGARAAGLDVGAALPIMASEHSLKSVLLILSSDTAPIARAFEVWDVNEGDESISLRTQTHTDCPNFAKSANELACSQGEGIVGAAWSSGLPVLCSNFAEVDPKRSIAADADGITSGVSLPIFVGERLKSVFVMFN
ncbi:MAG: GAF domain-containing protein [Planctomycetales bacterium]|nr:GAF domain-containing protein [Planctomycetales bacterium]